MGFYHRTNVYRTTQTTDETGKKTSSESLIKSNLPCRVGPLEAKIQKGVFGDYSSDRIFIEWGTFDLHNGDVILYQGDRYKFKPLNKDIHRPAFSKVPAYKTGALTLEGRQRT